MIKSRENMDQIKIKEDVCLLLVKEKCTKLLYLEEERLKK